LAAVVAIVSLLVVAQLVDLVEVVLTQVVEIVLVQELLGREITVATALIMEVIQSVAVAEVANLLLVKQRKAVRKQALVELALRLQSLVAQLLALGI